MFNHVIFVDKSIFEKRRFGIVLLEDVFDEVVHRSWTTDAVQSVLLIQRTYLLDHLLRDSSLQKLRILCFFFDCVINLHLSFERL